MIVSLDDKTNKNIKELKYTIINNRVQFIYSGVHYTVELDCTDGIAVFEEIKLSINTEQEYIEYQLYVDCIVDSSVEYESLYCFDVVDMFEQEQVHVKIYTNQSNYRAESNLLMFDNFIIKSGFYICYATSSYRFTNGCEITKLYKYLGFKEFKYTVVGENLIQVVDGVYLLMSDERHEGLGVEFLKLLRCYTCTYNSYDYYIFLHKTQVYNSFIIKDGRLIQSLNSFGLTILDRRLI